MPFRPGGTLEALEGLPLNLEFSVFKGRPFYSWDHGLVKSKNLFLNVIGKSSLLFQNVFGGTVNATKGSTPEKTGWIIAVWRGAQLLNGSQDIRGG